MDLDLLGDHLNTLLSGGEVELPRYDFKAGRPFFEGNRMRLSDNDILVMEGIHALDPAMVPTVDQSRIYRVYASALTSLNVDENNNISTTDNRLLRRMVRDNRTRGIGPEGTILRWPSVRCGENKYIFPFQENADAQFNSALLYELPLLKYFAEPLLRRIHPSSPAYTEAIRLLKFLDYIVALQPSEIEAIPPTSILREVHRRPDPVGPRCLICQFFSLPCQNFHCPRREISYLCVRTQKFGYGHEKDCYNVDILLLMCFRPGAVRGSGRIPPVATRRTGPAGLLPAEIRRRADGCRPRPG